MTICPHCKQRLREPQLPRVEKANKLAKLLSKEFKKRDLLNKPCPSRDIAELAHLALEKGLSSPKTAKGDRIFSLFKHLHAYSENLKPYGPGSRRQGHYRAWMNSVFGAGQATVLIHKAERIYKEIKDGAN